MMQPHDGVVSVPPHVVVNSSGPPLLAEPDPVGAAFVSGGLLSLVQRPVTDHGKEDAQQASSHGDVGLGLADAAEQALSDRLLAGVGAAQGDGGLADGPGFLGSSGRLQGTSSACWSFGPPLATVNS